VLQHSAFAEAGHSQFQSKLTQYRTLLRLKAWFARGRWDVPCRRVSGIRHPWLQSPDCVNYSVRFSNSFAVLGEIAKEAPTVQLLRRQAGVISFMQFHLTTPVVTHGTNPENAAYFMYCPSLGRISAIVSGRLPRSRLLDNLPGRRTRRSAVGQDYLRHGDLSTLICANLAARQLPSSRQLSRYRPSERGDFVTHGIILPTSNATDSGNDPRAV
jgi:hypothetical protein